MIPIYRYMDSHPFQKNQTPFNPYQYPIMESVPSYMTMDPSKSCMPSHDSGRNCWHYGYPMPAYSCCNGGNCFPGYNNFRPPHLHVSPHQHAHSYGVYPPCPKHVQYVPPTPYNVEQSRYEFDKNMMRNHHCCGCPNSLCGQNQKEDKCVKIEEEKPNDQRKGSLVQFQNNQSPIVWIPPDYIESEKETPSETGAVKQEKERHGSNLKSVEQEFWNGWPLSDLSRHGSWLPDAEGMGIQSVRNKQQEGGNKEFPFPYFLMPARKTDVQNKDDPRKFTEEPSNVGKLVPTHILQKDDATSEDPEVVKTINQSNIPETDMNRRTEDVNKRKERRCIPVETVKDNKERESSRNNVKGESSSSPKKSRLPPVCLRVDPLPKKKNGNGSSRSQSSPKSTAVKESSQSGSKIIKAIEVKSHENPEDISSAGEPLSLPTQPQPQEKLFDKLCKEETEESTSEEYRTISQVSTDKAVDEGLEVRLEDLVQEEGKNEKLNLSDVEAAVLIQSAYRGYEVRKRELLKKMKQLADVREHVIEVQNRVKALELASKDEKERMFVGEMIMRLLLKLDTIQGLHPNVKEFRKSLAKELVALQEKLDCMVIKPTEVVPEVSIEKPIERFDVETHDDIKEEAQHKDDVVEIGEIIPVGANESNSLMGESRGAQPLCGIDDTADFEGVKSSADEELHRLTGYERIKLLEVDDQNTNVSEAEQLVEEPKKQEAQNEGTFELSSQNFSNQIRGEKVMRSLMGVKKSDEAESGAEMEQNVEVMNNAEKKVGEVLQTDVKEETVDDQAYSLEDGQHPRRDSWDVSNCISDDPVGTQAGQTPGVHDKITLSAPDENGQTEDQLAADMELPMREDDSRNNIEADIEMRREVPEAEENARDLEVELSSDRTLNKEEGREEFHAVGVGFEHNEECLSRTKCENEKEGASDESAELPGERSNSNDDLNIQNESVTERNKQRTSDEVEKVLEDVQHQPKPSSELDNQANKLHTAGEETSTEMREESLLNASQESTDKKLVEENEKMKEVVEKLMEASKEQIAIISKLSGRVKDLEKRVARKKKVRRRGCGMSM